MKSYPKSRSEVQVIFEDGTTQVHQISASSAIATHLSRQAAHTGFLTLLDATNGGSVAIPVRNIASWTITTAPPTDTGDTPTELRDKLTETPK